MQGAHQLAEQRGHAGFQSGGSKGGMMVGGLEDPYPSPDIKPLPTPLTLNTPDIIVYHVMGVFNIRRAGGG